MKQPCKVVLRRSSTPVKMVVIAAIALALAALLSVHIAIRATKAQTEDLRGQAAALEQESQQLDRYEKESGTVQEILRIAREILGLVEPDSVVIQPE
jgi:cell division protein FtsB